MKKFVLVAALAVVAIFSVVASASAETDQAYFTGYIAGGGHADGWRHTLHWNVASTTNRVCAGQLDANGNWTGSYQCANGSVTKWYCQCALYYPRVHNGESYTQFFAADEIW